MLGIAYLVSLPESVCIFLYFLLHLVPLVVIKGNMLYVLGLITHFNANLRQSWSLLSDSVGSFDIAREYW